MPDLVAGWGNTGRALRHYDANGHYARMLPQFGAFEESAGRRQRPHDGPSRRRADARAGVVGCAAARVRRPGRAGGGELRP